MFPFGRPRGGSKLRDVPQSNKDRKDLTGRVVKSDLLLEERRIDAAADSVEKNSAMADQLRTLEIGHDVWKSINSGVLEPGTVLLNARGSAASISTTTLYTRRPWDEPNLKKLESIHEQAGNGVAVRVLPNADHLEKIAQLKAELAALEEMGKAVPTPQTSSDTGTRTSERAKVAVEKEFCGGKKLPPTIGKLLTKPSEVEDRPQGEKSTASKPAEKTKEGTTEGERKDGSAPKKDGSAGAVESKGVKEGVKPAASVTSTVTNRLEALEEHGTKDQQKKLDTATAKRASSMWRVGIRPNL